MRTIIIDNDMNTVMFLQKQMSELDIIKVFTSNRFDLSTIESLEPELIFMNIYEPSCIHIGLIQYMFEHNLSSYLVVIKDYNEDVSEGFEDLNSIKFIEKPFTEEKAKRLSAQIEEDIVYPIYPEVEVCLFKYFHFKKNGTRYSNVKWRTAKSRELLVYLLQHHNEVVRKDVLVELLWPEMTPEKGYNNLYAAIYYLRKLLRELNIGIHINSDVHGYEIELINVTCDMIEFEGLIEEITDKMYENVHINEIMKLFKNIQALYVGEYLKEESYIWKENKRDKYRIQYLSIARKVIDSLKERGEYTDAIVLALHIQKLYKNMDYSYFTLMKLYNEFGDIQNVEKEYMKLKKMLDIEFNTQPNNTIKDWYKTWIEKQFI